MKSWPPAHPLLLALLLALLSAPPASAVVTRRTCFCDVRLGRLMFSARLLDVPDPVLKEFLVSCRRAEAWCPDACRRAARATLTQGGSGDVSPLEGVAGQTACTAMGLAITAAETPVHLYATYRVSNCRHSGSHYLGRLCCRPAVSAGGNITLQFDETCGCADTAMAPMKSTAAPTPSTSGIASTQSTASTASATRAASTAARASTAVSTESSTTGQRRETTPKPTTTTAAATTGTRISTSASISTSTSAAATNTTSAAATNTTTAGADTNTKAPTAAIAEGRR